MPLLLFFLHGGVIAIVIRTVSRSRLHVCIHVRILCLLALCRLGIVLLGGGLFFFVFLAVLIHLESALIDGPLGGV